MPSKFQNDAIFWVEVDKIKPNPYQPRRDFNEDRLRDLAESIRQYGVLQPLTVTRKEEVKEDGGLKVEYELIAGERRHRASQLANLSQVPVIIRSGQEDAQVKLELAIIENLQREDLNPIERAEAFDQLANEFEFTHREIAEKIGKSREYVSNSMRLLKLPEEIKNAIVSGQMTEGHARPIMMLRDKPEQQEMLFKEVIHKGLTVREAESIARRDAQDKVRKKKNKIKPETKALEDRLSNTFGTRVKIEERDVGGKLVIDFFSEEDLENIIKLVQGENVEIGDVMEKYVKNATEEETEQDTKNQPEADQEETLKNKKEASTGGKSIADTLGTMIAAARAQQQASASTDNVKESADTEKDNQIEESVKSTLGSQVNEQPEQEVRHGKGQEMESVNKSTDEDKEDFNDTNQENKFSDEPEDNSENRNQAVSTAENSEEGKSNNDTFARSVPTSTQSTDEDLGSSQNNLASEDIQDKDSEEESKEEDKDDMYSISNFSI